MSKTLQSRITEKVSRVRTNMPQCKDRDTIQRLAKAEVEGDIWREISSELSFSERDLLDTITKRFQSFKSDLYLKFRNEGESKAKQALDEWLANKEWSNGKD